MMLDARGPALLFGALSLLTVCPRLASAQSPDSLPTLDDSTLAAPPETSPEAPSDPPIRLIQSTTAPPVRLALGPIRAQRRLALTGEVGWNGIAGFGPNLTFHADPHLSFDAGAGLSLLGWKVGLRSRYNFLTGRVTPFLGVGVMGAAGFGDSPIPINDHKDPSRETVNIKILPSAWLQTVAGVDWIAPSGFTLIGTSGYAFLLSRDPVQVVTGSPNKDEELGFDIAFRSNLVITIALGYTFR
jgi:hypothetical protein